MRETEYPISSSHLGFVEYAAPFSGTPLSIYSGVKRLWEWIWLLRRLKHRGTHLASYGDEQISLPISDLATVDEDDRNEIL